MKTKIILAIALLATATFPARAQTRVSVGFGFGFGCRPATRIFVPVTTEVCATTVAYSAPVVYAPLVVSTPPIVVRQPEVVYVAASPVVYETACYDYGPSISIGFGRGYGRSHYRMPRYHAPRVVHYRSRGCR